MLSLVIGCLNEGVFLQDTITKALALTAPPGGVEISIFDDGSVDGTSAFLDQEPWLEYRRNGMNPLTTQPRSRGHLPRTLQGSAWLPW